MIGNPHEEHARAKKVIALLSVIPATRTQAENDLLALFLESLNQKQRNVFAVLAPCNDPSPTTWEMVVAAVRARHVPGDGGAIDRHTDIRRPDFTDTIRKAHRAHYQKPGRCVACEVLGDVLNRTFDDGVTTALRAVGL